MYSAKTLIWLVALAVVRAQNVDQRQSGDYNIHISLKDIKIIALLGGGLGSEDYDYNYDYSELTIKPPLTLNSTTTIKPSTGPSNSTVSTTTVKVVEITPPPPSIPTTQSTAVKNVTEKPLLTPKPPNTQSSEIPVQIVFTPVGVQSSVPTTTKKPNPMMAALMGNSTRADCIEGFFKDREGNCRPKVKKLPQQTLLRKLIQMSQRTQHPKKPIVAE